MAPKKSRSWFAKNVDCGWCTLIGLIIQACIVFNALYIPSYNNAFSELLTAQKWNDTKPQLLVVMCENTSQVCVEDCLNVCDYYGYTLERTFISRTLGQKTSWKRNSIEEESIAYRYSDEHKRGIKKCVRCHVSDEDLGNVVEEDVIWDKYFMRVVLVIILLTKGLPVCISGSRYYSNRSPISSVGKADCRDDFYLSIVDLMSSLSLFITVPLAVMLSPMISTAATTAIKVVLRPPEF